MRKTVFIVLGGLFVFLLCVQSFKNSQPSAKKENALHKTALTKALAEPKVKDAYINDANVLYAAVLDDGTRRDGYAMYLCGEVRNFGVDRVKVIKYGSSKDPNRDNAYGVLLGECDCRSY